MSEAPETVFKFTAEGVDLEFAGTEEFVERQVQRFRKFLEGAVGVGDEAGAEAGASAAAPSQEGFAEFSAKRPVREGRGAIQDRILLSIYYMNAVKKKRDVSG